MSFISSIIFLLLPIKPTNANIFHKILYEVQKYNVDLCLFTYEEEIKVVLKDRRGSWIHDSNALGHFFDVRRTLISDLLFALSLRLTLNEARDRFIFHSLSWFVLFTKNYSYRETECGFFEVWRGQKNSLLRPLTKCLLMSILQRIIKQYFAIEWAENQIEWKWDQETDI